MTEPLYCINHPTVETYLRCARCDAPICAKCAVQTEVGYICRNCLDRQQRAFYAAFRPIYYLVAAAVALPLGLIAGWFVPALGWFAIFLGPLAGGGIAEVAWRAIRRRRGRYTWLVVAGAIAVGGLPRLLIGLIPLVVSLADPTLLPVGVWPLVWTGVYLFTAVGAAIARLRT